MSARPKDGAVSAPDDLGSRLASAAAQAVRKTHSLTGVIPGRSRSAEFRVRFADGRRAVYRVSLDFVREIPRQ